MTSVTYARSVSSIPYLREKVEAVIENSGFLERSHDRKALRHILERYPRDELFQMEEKDLFNTSVNILRLQEKQRIALFLRKDPFGRYISCLIYIPRDRFSSELRETMIGILEEELQGTCGNFYTNMDDSVFARVAVTIHISQQNQPKFKVDDLEQLLVDAGRTWPERLSAALYKTEREPDECKNLTVKYADAFPVSYTSRYKAKQAVFDIEKIETALQTGQLQLELYRPEDVSLRHVRLKLYNPGEPVTLSDVMPILENIGLRTISELPFEITPAGENAQSLWIHDFLVEIPEIKEVVNVADVKANFERAFSKIWAREVENDGLNRLLLSAGLNWHEITILRAYVRYLKQIGSPFSRPYIQKALTSFPKIAKTIVALFKAFHDPANGDNAETLAAGCAVSIDHALEAVESLDQDRILRSLTNLVESTLRTNYYQREPDGSAKSYLAFKIDSRRVEGMPEPKPFVEIFVYSTKVEGIHLRGDRIARGGIRWSDRHEDFRTEVLGLMKAQMVKNAVIVPTGAKGGFVVKTPTSSREEFMKEGVECYKTFIRALLDITDNRKGNKTIPPKNVVRRDGDDPYLVVAADKGTATFSDIANGISAEYSHWLGDAFASGGSAGYDHKKMGITARGAWESVKAHFRALGHNIQQKPFDVIGVGDMGGDVFGNGMLLSEHIRLVGAFNHLHIFCDPNPDTAISFKERKRLFDAVKGWDQYDTKTLSPGGRIYNRSDKILELTPEIKVRFGIEKDKVSPNELMKAMLKAQTDLLWFGGIGTYIKSSKQTHADAGDKANDAIRIDAPELRAKVIGEGANLAVTQLGRIEFAERGGKLNTDFVDNSGGVNSSDVEVNIKILMTDIMRDKAGSMDIPARNKLLESMTEDVSQLVLRNNYQQAQAVSLAEIQAREQLQAQEDFIKDLERNIGLDRRIEGLPDTETVEARLRAGKGLTRPELCILISYAKIGFTKALLKSDIPDNPGMEDWAVNYFPPALRSKYRKFMLDHQLHREIIATSMSNSLINRMGPTFIRSRVAKTGADVADIARAYIVVREAFGLRKLWDDIEALDNKAPALVQLKAMKEIAALASHAVTWFLTRLGRPLDIASDTAAFAKGVEAFRKGALELLSTEMKESTQQHIEVLMRDGLPQHLAEQIALMPVLASACDIIKIALERKTDLMETARSYFQLGERFHMGWLRQQARFLSADDHWQAEAVSGLIDQLYSCQAGMTVSILNHAGKSKAKGKTSFDSWMESYAKQAAQLDPLFADLRRAGTLDLPMLVIAEQRLRQLYGG
ncbi:MAG: NAD-glutamate dehydrogenase [Alphaproteobacteria bacterium]|nr:NAD-glutamate dehydrogenase [Alphaproteobacteria bacterium]